MVGLLGAFPAQLERGQVQGPEPEGKGQVGLRQGQEGQRSKGQGLRNPQVQVGPAGSEGFQLSETCEPTTLWWSAADLKAKKDQKRSNE
jgi:hypothetical protein